MSENEDFISPMMQAALAMREMFDTLVAAGFTEKQALLIVAELVSKQI